MEKAIIKQPINAEKAPNRNIGLLPNLPIKRETGIKLSAIVRNWIDKGKVAKAELADKLVPTNPVFIILILVVVIDKPWAIESINVFLLFNSNYLLSLQRDDTNLISQSFKNF